MSTKKYEYIRVFFLCFLFVSSGEWGKGKIQIDAFTTGNPFGEKNYLQLIQGGIWGLCVKGLSSPHFQRIFHTRRVSI